MGGHTHKNQYSCTEKHQMLDGGLIERIFNRIRMLIVAVITLPRVVNASRAITWAAGTDKLELYK